jgi:hypothetical protein
MGGGENCDILGYNSGVVENTSLQGCYALPIGKELATFRTKCLGISLDSV